MVAMTVKAVAMKLQKVTTIGAFFALALILTAATCRKDDPAPASVDPPRFVRESQSPKNEKVVVFVHGILGDSVSTWTAANGAYWPKLLLDDPAFSRTDVFVHDFPTPMLRRSYTIDELADDMRRAFEHHQLFERYKKVIFLAHSMGGLVTRQYLLKYRPQPDRVPLIFFYSTPGTGSDLADLGKLVSRNPQLADMRKMSTDDPGILGIQQSAWLASEYSKRIASHCAYERLPTKQIFVVERESATALCNTRLDPIVRDHIDIVKPLNNVDDVSYIAFRQAFLNAVGRDDLLDGSPAGQLRLHATVKTAEWQPTAPAVRERGTGDHHCESDCRDEPTRTNYQIVIEADPGHRFTSASLACIAGPCGGWLAVLSERIEADGRRAVGSFDVWSRPTTWRLTATQEKLVEVARNVETAPQQLIYGRTIDVRVPKDAVAAEIIIQTEDGRTLTTPVAAPSPSSGLQLLQQRSEGGEVVYVYKVGPRP